MSSPSSGSGAEQKQKSNLVHFGLKMTSGGNNFNHFAENHKKCHLVLEMREISVTDKFQGYFSMTFQELKL